MISHICAFQLYWAARCCFAGLYLSYCPVDYRPDFRSTFFERAAASAQPFGRPIWSDLWLNMRWYSAIAVRAECQVSVGVHGIDPCEIVCRSIIWGRKHKNRKVSSQGIRKAMFTSQETFHEQIPFVCRSRFPEALVYEDRRLTVYLGPVHSATPRWLSGMCIGFYYCRALLIGKDNGPHDYLRHRRGPRGIWEPRQEFVAGQPVRRGNMRVLGVKGTGAQVFIIIGLRGGGNEAGKKNEWKKPRMHECLLQRYCEGGKRHDSGEGCGGSCIFICAVSEVK